MRHLRFVFSLILVGGCESAAVSERGVGAPGGGSSTGTGSTGGAASVATDAGAGLIPSGAGVLTAGAWDDNLNFDFYRAYTTSMAELAGRPRAVHGDRMVISARSGSGAALPGATVIVASGGATKWMGTTGSDGTMLFFPGWAGVPAGAALQLTASSKGSSVTISATSGDPSATLSVPVAAPAVASIDVALVIDTTGSMGDEIAYLRDEFQSITASLTARFPGVDQRWALVVYRDVGMNDDYTVKHYDFTGDAAAFRATLAMQSAGGGGDYPESPELGLLEAAGLSWRKGATARLAFWIADAPHHVGREAALLDSFDQLHRLGVHAYPISASGTDELLEYSMRAAAELTGGRYLFLTSDSGVGDAHKEPTIPCYLVTHLHSAIVRMATMELRGALVAPDPSEVIRSTGNPKDGVCTVHGTPVQLL